MPTKGYHSKWLREICPLINDETIDPYIRFGCALVFNAAKGAKAGEADAKKWLVTEPGKTILDIVLQTVSVEIFMRLLEREL